MSDLRKELKLIFEKHKLGFSNNRIKINNYSSYRGTVDEFNEVFKRFDNEIRVVCNNYVKNNGRSFFSSVEDIYIKERKKFLKIS